MPVPVNLKDGKLMVNEGGNKVPLVQYQAHHGYDDPIVVVPEGVNSTTLQGLQHKTNRNRISKAAHPIKYVGQDDEQMFGKGSSNKQKRTQKRKEETAKENIDINEHKT